MRPLVRGGRAQRDVAVLRAERLVRRRDSVGRAEAAGHLAGREVAARLPDAERHRRLEQAQVDVLAPPGLLAGDVRRQDGVAAEQRAGQVRDRHADLDGRALRLAGDAHDAAHALEDQVEAGPLAVRPGLAEAGGRAVDDVRADRSTAS